MSTRLPLLSISSCCRYLMRSRPPVPVLQAHDVVLAQVAAHLHLDQLQRNAARVLQRVHCAYWQVDRLVLGQQPLLAVQRDAGRALD